MCRKLPRLYGSDVVPSSPTGFHAAKCTKPSHPVQYGKVRPVRRTVSLCACMGSPAETYTYKSGQACPIAPGRWGPKGSGHT